MTKTIEALVGIFVIFSLVNSTLYNKEDAIKILNSLLKESKWKLNEESLYDYLAKKEVKLNELILNDLSEENNVNSENFLDKLSNTTLLLNWEYTKIFYWISSRLFEFASLCNGISQNKDNMHYEADLKKCIVSLKYCVNKSVYVLQKLISAMNFLQNLTELQLNNFLLPIIKHFVSLLDEIILKDDVDFIWNLSPPYNHTGALTQVLLQYEIKISIYCQEESQLKYEEYCNIKELQPGYSSNIDFLKDQFEETINHFINLYYIDLGFSYNKENDESTFVDI